MVVSASWESESGVRLQQNGGAVLLSFSGHPTPPTQWMRSISGNNYSQAAFQEGGNLSFHLQQDGGGVMEAGAQQVRLEAKGGGHNGCRQEGHFCSAYLEVVITVSGFIFPCVTGCRWPLGRALHVKAINNIKNVQYQQES